MRKHSKSRYGRRVGEGVKTSMRVAIKHGWKSSMNVTPWDYLDQELTRLKRQAMPALERARMDVDAALKALAAAGGHTKRSRSRARSASPNEDGHGSRGSWRH